jgi:hypothetical protein
MAQNGVCVMRVWSVLGVLVLVAACTLSKPDPQPTGPSPITGGEISVTPLDAPSPAPETKPETKPAPAAIPEAAAKPAPEAPAAAPPPPALSPEELACTDKGGLWGAVGKGGAACLMPTRDSGKQCRKESDCEGYCLARSGTCAPYSPMFGCNDIVQDNGVVVTLCID